MPLALTPGAPQKRRKAAKPGPESTLARGHLGQARRCRQNTATLDGGRVSTLRLHSMEYAMKFTLAAQSGKVTASLSVSAEVVALILLLLVL